MRTLKRWLSAADSYQQARPWLAFPLAVVKKFGDDSAGNLAALIAWSAMAAVFPLLLVLVTVLGIVLHNDPSLHQKVLNSALSEFPIIGTTLKQSTGHISGSGLGLAIGIVGTFLGARGVASAAQNAMNSVWEVPYDRRPRFPKNQLRSIGLVIVLGVGIIATTMLAGLGGGTGGVGAGIRVAAVGGALGLNVLVFMGAFRLATASEVSWNDLWLGAVLTAVVWQVLQLLGGYIVARDVRNMQAVYGFFAFTLGLMAWFYLQAQLTLYAVEADVVRTRRLWPRTFVGDGRTKVDEQAYTAYSEVEKRTDDQVVDVRFEPDAARGDRDRTAAAAGSGAGGRHTRRPPSDSVGPT